MITRITAAGSVFLAAACSGLPEEPVPPPLPARPGILAGDDLPAVRALLREDNPSASFGLPDGTTSSVLVMLPPPLSDKELMSPARPVVFDILIDAEGCYLDRRDTPDVVRLIDIPCTPYRRPRR
ncbi:MAG: hypothetical protein AAGH41_11190 [Pseudomonadota bacterium]